MAAGILELAKMRGILVGIAATTALSLGERSLSELRSVPSISEQMALKVMDELDRELLNGLITNLGKLLRSRFKNPW
jgi:hypothetical protein